jgi:small subunit ribosomal protein S20
VPKTKSAKKALRVSERRKKYNLQFKQKIKALIKEFKKETKKSNLKTVVSILDKAASKNVIHKNKAARLKSRLSRLTKKETTPKPTTKKRGK